jgi:mannose/fructose/N-acetylgalactosamine-specific phosphotransferase system component IIB
MSLTLFRIDDRLIHGQVVTFWTRRLDSNHIVIASDEVAKDAFLKKVLKMTAPLGVKVSIFTQEETLNAFRDGTLEKDRVLLLVKSPEDAKALIDGGLETGVVNVGGMGAKPGTTSLYKNISALPEQIEIFRELTARGVSVEFQILPDHDAVTFDQLKLK